MFKNDWVQQYISKFECNSVEPSPAECNSNKCNSVERSAAVQTKQNQWNSFDCFGKSLIVLFVTTASISIASFATVIGAPVGMVSASFSLAFSISTGIIKKLLKAINKKKKRNKIVMLYRSKLKSIESKISEAVIDSDISHEDFMTIINEEKKNIEN